MERIFIQFDNWVSSENCREISSFIKTWQEQGVLYMKTYIHFWLYLAQLFLEWEMFLLKVVDEIKTQFICNNFFFLENLPVMR